VSTDPIVLEVRRSRKRFVAHSIQTYGPLVMITLIASMLFGDLRSRVIAVTIVIVVAVSLSTVYFRRARVFLTADKLGLRGWFGTWWIPRSDLARALLVESLEVRSGKRGRELFLFDRAGKRVSRLSGRGWGNASIFRIAQALAVPLATIERRMSVKELSVAEPAALRWYEYRPYLLIGILLVAVAVAVAGVIAAAVALAG